MSKKGVLYTGKYGKGLPELRLLRIVPYNGSKHKTTESIN